MLLLSSGGNWFPWMRVFMTDLCLLLFFYLSCRCLFVLLIPDFFFFFESEVNLDVNLPSFFFFFLNWGFHLTFLSPLSSLLSSLSSSQQPRALRLLQKSVLSILGCSTKVAESVDMIQVLGSLLQLEMIPGWFGVCSSHLLLRGFFSKNGCENCH